MREMNNMLDRWMVIICYVYVVRIRNYGNPYIIISSLIVHSSWPPPLLPIEMMMWLQSTHLLFVRTCFWWPLRQPVRGILWPHSVRQMACKTTCKKSAVQLNILAGLQATYRCLWMSERFLSSRVSSTLTEVSKISQKSYRHHDLSWSG